MFWSKDYDVVKSRHQTSRTTACTRPVLFARPWVRRLLDSQYDGCVGEIRIRTLAGGTQFFVTLPNHPLLDPKKPNESYTTREQIDDCYDFYIRTALRRFLEGIVPKPLVIGAFEVEGQVTVSPAATTQAPTPTDAPKMTKRSREQIAFALLIGGFIVTLFACIAAWLVVPQVQEVIQSFVRGAIPMLTPTLVSPTATP